MNINENTSSVLPTNINKVVPVADENAIKITKLIKHSNKVIGYELSNNTTVSKEDAISMAKEGHIKGVAVALNKGNEYLRTLPDESESNNLSSLPTITN